MRDKDNVELEVVIYLNKIIVIDGHYNIRTNFVHLSPTDEQETDLALIGLSEEELVRRIEEREIELN